MTLNLVPTPELEYIKLHKQMKQESPPSNDLERSVTGM